MKKIKWKVNNIIISDIYALLVVLELLKNTSKLYYYILVAEIIIVVYQYYFKILGFYICSTYK